ncbi:MAG: tyrosine-type recombinase/integrase [Anaerolineae bacterium]
MDLHLEQFAEHLVARGYSRRTCSGYVRDITAFAKWLGEAAGEDFRVERVTAVDIRQYACYLTTVAKMKPASVSRRLAALRRWFAWLVTQGVIPANPAAEVDLPVVARQIPRGLSASEVYRLRRAVRAAGDARDVAIVEVLLNTGLRVSELCALTFDDVEMSDRKGKVVVRSGKGGTWREVPLNGEARQALGDYLRRVGTREGPVFVGKRGPLTPSAVFRIVQKYGKKAGVEISPHTLRHTFATWLLRNAGADIVMVKDLLGHKYLNTTAVYTRASREDVEEAVENLTWFNSQTQAKTETDRACGKNTGKTR